MPTVTATAKPALFPLGDAIDPASPTTDQHAFTPYLRDSDKALTTRRFRDLLGEQGHQFLKDGQLGDPSGTAWLEIGTLDKHGHDEEWKIARRVSEVLHALHERIRGLLDAGWSTVRVVTDHGWLVLPSALPKEPLPHYLASTRWGRCAMLKDGNQANRPTVGWHWNPNVRIALAPGIHVHRNGLGYAHGGLSVQESVVPRLTVRAGASTGPRPQIADVKWTRMRCRLRVEDANGSLSVDLRTQANDPDQSIAMKPKPVGDGTASLVVVDPSNEGRAATVVLLDANDTVLDTYPTEVGRNA